MTSMLKGKMGPTTHAVERSHNTAAVTGPLNIRSVNDHIRRMGTASETCSAAPSTDDIGDPNELIESFKSLCVDRSKGTATPEPFPDKDSSEDSDSDWYTSDNDEGQTKAYPPFSKFGGYSFKFDPTDIDRKIINRRYFVAPGADAVPWWFCWGVDPRSEHITFLYRVEVSAEICFHQHRIFHHLDSNDGPCPRDLGYHFFQPARTIYRQNDTGTGYESVPMCEEEAFNQFLLICQTSGGQAVGRPASPGRGAAHEPLYQQVAYDHRPGLFQSPSSSQGTSLQSSPYSLDGDFSSRGSGTPWSSPGALANWSPHPDMTGSSQDSGTSRQLPAASEPPLFPDPPGARLDDFLRDYQWWTLNTQEITAMLGTAGPTTGYAGVSPVLPTNGISWPEDENQVMRIAGLETEDNVDTYLGTFTKILKERQLSDVYCWECKHGERRRSVEQCKQNCTKLSSLKRHVMGHLKINNFSCAARGCTFKTSHKDNLTRHTKEYHAGNRRPIKDQTTRGNRWNPLKPARGETIRSSQ